MNRDLKIINDWIQSHWLSGHVPDSIVEAADRLTFKPKPVKKVLDLGRAKLTRAQLKARSQNVRLEADWRAGGVCEWCHLPKPTEHHHLDGGGGRLEREKRSNTAMICRDCHRGWEAGDLDVLRDALYWARNYQYADSIRLVDRKRDKVMESREAAQRAPAARKVAP